MKNWNIIYKAELSNDRTFLVFSEGKTNRLKYRLINTKYKTPADLGLIELVNLPDALGETDEDEIDFEPFITSAPTYDTNNGITIIKSIRIRHGKTL